MKGLINFLEKYFVPVAGKIGAQRHLVAIRDGFVVLMPLIIAGSMGVLINNLPIKPYQNFMIKVFGDGWRVFGNNLWEGAFGVMSLLVVCTIAYNLAKSYKGDGIAAAMLSLGSLIIIMEGTADGTGIPTQWTGSLGLFVAIFVALIVTEIFVRLAKNKRLIIRMPDNVPPAVSKSFAALLPAMITLAIMSLVKIMLSAIGIADLHQIIYEALQSPLLSMANTLWSAIIIVLFNHLFWFFGLHGSNILEPVMQSVYLPALDANAKAVAAGLQATNIVTKPFFDCFIYMGGSGATICLIIAIYIASRRKHYKNMAALSNGPGLFNINEPLVYGMPIVLNPVFFIPFILTPVILTIVSYLAIASHIVPPTIVMVPWTTPPILSGFFATGSIMGSVLQIVNLAIGILIYIPFIKMAERIEGDKEIAIGKVDNNLSN